MEDSNKILLNRPYPHSNGTLVGYRLLEMLQLVRKYNDDTFKKSKIGRDNYVRLEKLLELRKDDQGSSLSSKLGPLMEKSTHDSNKRKFHDISYNCEMTTSYLDEIEDVVKKIIYNVGLDPDYKP
jgi:hypothetical protein